MYNPKGLEKLWLIYKTEGAPKGVFINVPYIVFYDWYKSTQKEAVPIEVGKFSTTA